MPKFRRKPLVFEVVKLDRDLLANTPLGKALADLLEDSEHDKFAVIGSFYEIYVIREEVFKTNYSPEDQEAVAYLEDLGFDEETIQDMRLITENLPERLADLEHRQWTHWMRYVFECSRTNSDGSITIPAEKVHRWSRQMETTYADLSEQEQESDMHWAMRVITLLLESGIKLDR